MPPIILIFAKMHAPNRLARGIGATKPVVAFGNLRCRSPLVAATNHDARGNAKPAYGIWFAGWANVDNASCQWQSVTRGHCVLWERNKNMKVMFFIQSTVCCALLSLLGVIECQAQTDGGLMVEVGGASTTLGLYYDSRFNADTRWGGRLGVAYATSNSRRFFNVGPDKTTGWSIPVAVNYLIGCKDHHAELGVGLSYGWYKCKISHANGYIVEEDRDGAFCFIDVGYRYQHANGVILRLGISPGIAVKQFDELGVSNDGVNRGMVVYPYISVGYSI